MPTVTPPHASDGPPQQPSSQLPNFFLPFGETGLCIAETAFATIPLLVLLIFGISCLIRTYGALMVMLLGKFKRIIVDLAQILVCVCTVMAFTPSASIRVVWLSHPELNFGRALSSITELCVHATGYSVLAICGIFIIEAIANGKRP